MLRLPMLTVSEGSVQNRWPQAPDSGRKGHPASVIQTGNFSRAPYPWRLPASFVSIGDCELTTSRPRASAFNPVAAVIQLLWPGYGGVIRGLGPAINAIWRYSQFAAFIVLFCSMDQLRLRAHWTGSVWSPMTRSTPSTSSACSPSSSHHSVA